MKRRRFIVFEFWRACKSPCDVNDTWRPNDETYKILKRFCFDLFGHVEFFILEMFRKPKRNVRQRKVSSDEGSDDLVENEEDVGLEELHSSINKFKEKKKSTKKDRRVGSGSSKSDKPKDDDGKKLLSFEQDLNEGGKFTTYPDYYVKMKN